MKSDAVAIYQEYLDKGSKAFIEGDLEAIAAGLCYPYTVHTFHSFHVMYDEQDAMKTIGALYHNMRLRGATHFIRACESARFLDPARKQIEGVHTSHFLCGDDQVVAPYRARIRLMHVGGVWKETEVKTELQNKSFPIYLPETGDSALTEN